MTQQIKLTRRLAMLGAMTALGGCSAVAALNSAAQPLDTYDLAPAAGATGGRRSSRTLLVARPEASAAIGTDRIMVKPDATSVTYLPDARWSDELPAVFQSLLVRSISGTGRLGYVGRSEGGPIANTALLVRMDAFEVRVLGEGSFEVVVDIALTLLDDRTQRVTGTRSFAQTAVAVDDSPTAIVTAFQSVLDVLLPEMANWAAGRA